jgi:hypothetical protein
MLFLIELDHVKSGGLPTREAARSFIEQIIFPTLTRAEQLVKERKILAGGPVAGRIALRFIIKADSALDADRLVMSLPLWAAAESRVTPIISFADRRKHVQALWEQLAPTRKRDWNRKTLPLPAQTIANPKKIPEGAAAARSKATTRS